jgi:hypothetical protein
MTITVDQNPQNLSSAVVLRAFLLLASHTRLHDE